MDLPEVSEDDLDETHDVTMLPEEEITRIRTSGGTKTADAAVSLNEQPPPVRLLYVAAFRPRQFGGDGMQDMFRPRQNPVLN